MATSQQPPASNPGADDASGGIPKGAGGTSASSAIDSPVPTEQKTIVGAVMETLGLTAPQEKRAEDVSAHAPDTAASSIPASTAPSTSTSHAEAAKPGDASNQTYVGAIGSAAAAGTAAVSNYLTGNSNNASTSTGTSTSTSGQDGTFATTSAAGYEPSKETATTGATSTTGEKTTTGSVADSAASTAKAASETVKETVEDVTEKATGSEEKEEGHPKKVSDHEAAIRENKSAIPTAGGQRLGEGHWGESKVVPDNPKPEEEASKVSSKEGQPDQSTADNTAKNTGGAENPHKHGLHGLTSSSKDDDDDHEKTKLVDKLKHKLHLDKKDKA